MLIKTQSSIILIYNEAQIRLITKDYLISFLLWSPSCWDNRDHSFAFLLVQWCCGRGAWELNPLIKIKRNFADSVLLNRTYVWWISSKLDICQKRIEEILSKCTLSHEGKCCNLVLAFLSSNTFTCTSVTSILLSWTKKNGFQKIEKDFQSVQLSCIQFQHVSKSLCSSTSVLQPGYSTVLSMCAELVTCFQVP